MPDSFNGVNFEIVVATRVTPLVPVWLDRHLPARASSVELSIDGTPSEQGLDRKWKPLTLSFAQSNLPPSCITAAMLAAFKAGLAQGGFQTLVLESVTRTVIFDPSSGVPLDVVEFTPQRYSTPIYQGTVRLLEKLT